MSESDVRAEVAPVPFADQFGGGDSEEPPGKPKRHPIWRDVPDHQWNDWRWQSQNAIRSVRQLKGLIAFSPWKPSTKLRFRLIISH
jgi:lysine 2,3-aminomutase